MIAIRYNVKDLGVKTALENFEQRLKRPEKPLRECGLVLLRSIAKNFKQGGRPVRWKKSIRALATGGQTLVDTSRLRKSIAMDVRGNTLTVGTNVKYARIHQLGGHIRRNVAVRSHWRLMTQAFGKAITGRKVLVRQHQRRVDLDMPARPFLLVQDPDRRMFKRIFADYLTK
jgi:phage gpG-like protein